MKLSIANFELNQTKVIANPIELQHNGIWDVSNQHVLFKRLLDAISKPGAIHNLADLLEGQSSLQGVLATLLDRHASLSDPYELLDQWTWERIGAQPTAIEKAAYIVCDGRQSPAQMSERSIENCRAGLTTLIIECDRLGIGELSLSLCGSSIRYKKPVWMTGVDPRWFTHGMPWRARQPLGVDIVLIDTHQMLALPRTTRILDIVADCL